MASTRDNNQPGNYFMEQRALELQKQYMTYIPATVAPETCFCGDGLLPGQIGNPQLARNAVEIESFLRGTGTNDLTKKRGQVIPEIKTLRTLDIFVRPAVFESPKFVIEKGQRLRFFE